MKTILGFIGFLTFSAAAWSQQTVAEFKWNDVAQAAVSNESVASAYQSLSERFSALRLERQRLLTTYTNGALLQEIQAPLDICLAQTSTVEAAIKEVKKRYPNAIAFLRGEATPVMVDGREALKIENTNDTPLPLQLTLLTIANPKISAPKYAVQGEFRYDAAPLSASVLEMLSYFQPAQEGLPADQPIGPMMSSWSPYSLTFDSAAAGESGPPARLEIKIFLAARSTVYLSPIKLVQYPAGKIWFYGSTAHLWWSNRTAGLVGGCGGAIIGCLGGLIGVLCGKGKGRGFVIGLLRIQIGLGVLLGVAGIAAFALHQPYAVWYPLLLPSIILVTLCWTGLSTISKRYQEHELRRMQALDAAG